MHKILKPLFADNQNKLINQQTNQIVKKGGGWLINKTLSFSSRSLS